MIISNKTQVRVKLNVSIVFLPPFSKNKTNPNIKEYGLVKKKIQSYLVMSY